jgi:hypothetical protein
VKFENPVALWGLASLILLILFSLWRQASAKVVVPSLLLWKKIPERNPPVRALRRPRWRLELLLQALAISAAVGALAKPYRETDQPKPRRVALVFDTSSRFRAGDRLTKFKAHARNLMETALKKDVVTCYDASPSPRSFKEPEEAKVVDVHVDLMPLLFAASAGADVLILYSDVFASTGYPVMFAAPADNAGIVAFSVSSDEAFIRIVNHGAARPIPVSLKAEGIDLREMIPAGQLTWTHKADYSKTAYVRIAIEPKDSFPIDDVVEATRLLSGNSLVTLTGRHHDGLVKAFRSMPAVTILRGTASARVAVGYDEAPGPGEFRVWVHTPNGKLSGELTLEEHPLLADLQPRLRELSSLTWGEVPAGGKALIRVGGKTSAALQGNLLHVCVDLNQWQNGLASFPIFWVNALDFAHKGAPGLTIIRSGERVQLAPGSFVPNGPPGVERSLTPEGVFIGYMAGSYRLSDAGDYKHLVVNLLDERESDTAGKEQPLSWNPSAPLSRTPLRADWSGSAAWCALAFLLLAWLLQLRPE